MEKIKHYFNDKQLDFLQEIGIDINDKEYSSDEILAITEAVEDAFQERGIEGDYVNSFGIKCEELLDIFGTKL